MNILVVENYRGTHLGLLERVLREAEAGIDLRRMHAGDPLPDDPRAHDGLVVLGGAQNALADAEHPYLPALSALTRAFTAADRPVLGICLGAQIVARGHGARNLLGQPIEIGWKEVRPTAEGRGDPLTAPLGAGAPLFHWHSDSFTLPPGATHLASSDQTENQAFRIGRTYGIQFHFEADRPLVAAWTAAAGPGTDEGRWPARHAEERDRLGPAAEETGLAIARAWVGLLKG